MGSAPRARDGSCGPHISLGCAQRKVAAAAVEKKGAMCLNPAHSGRFGQVRGVPTGDIGRLRQDTTLGAGSVLLKLAGTKPATGSCEVGVSDRFDLRFPAAAALPTSNQSALSEAGSAEREVGALRQPPPKAPPNPPNAGKHHLCSPRPKRTRQETALSRGHRLARPPY